MPVSKSIRVAVDAMGGDHGCAEVVLAAAQVSRSTSIQLTLFGDREAIAAQLDRVEHVPAQIEVVHTDQAIAQDEKPRQAIDDKPRASLCLAMQATGAGEASACVSAGSTGALVLAASRFVPKIAGVQRAALAAVYPTRRRAGNDDRFALMLDVGATVRCRSQDLLFFAYMGHAYASGISKVSSPSIGLLNMGSEPSKGGEVLVEAHRLMHSDPLLNFIGNVEGNDIPMGKADVIVCEGLIGNITLKMGEGVGEVFKSLGRQAYKQNLLWRAGLTLLSGGLRRLKNLTDYSEYGGAPLLGFSQLVLKAHGRSRAKALSNAIKVAAKAARDGVCPRIEAAVAEYRERSPLVEAAGTAEP